MLAEIRKQNDSFLVQIARMDKDMKEKEEYFN
jgi:hypothetical protein